MMKNIIKFIFILILISISQVSFAENTPHYIVVFDAGSTGTRLHLYQYQQSPNAFLKLSEIPVGTHKSKPGISSYADHPKDAYLAIKDLISSVNTKLSELHVNEKNIPLYLLATAGMREVPSDKQQTIYNTLKSYLQKTTTFQVKKVATIPGNIEGVYGWVAVNYLKKTLQNNKPTIGTLDMGGSSTEIAFESNQANDGNDTFQLDLGSKHYQLFTHSFLGLGQNDATKATLKNACYPRGYHQNNLQGDFQFNQCNQAVNDLLIEKQVSTIVPKIPQDMDFYAFSGFYYTISFFGADKTQPIPTTLKQAIQQTCKLSWGELQAKYSKVPEKYLATDCFTGTYELGLLVNQTGYQFTSNTKHLFVANTINDTEIDWTQGAAIYHVLNPVG